MGPNRSLDEFLDPSPSIDDPSPSIDEEAHSTDNPARSTEPVGPTIVYAWDPLPRSCERCGESVHARWFDGTEPCCSDCKPW